MNSACALVKASRDKSDRRHLVRERLERYTITETARGYEQAALTLHR